MLTSAPTIPVTQTYTTLSMVHVPTSLPQSSQWHTRVCQNLHCIGRIKIPGGVGGRRRTKRYSRHQNDSAPSAESHFNVLLFVRGEVKSSCVRGSVHRSQLWKRAERAKAESNQGPSACQPNTLSLGQTSLLYIGALVVRW